MSGDNLACHRGSTLIFSGGGGGGGVGDTRALHKAQARFHCKVQWAATQIQRTSPTQQVQGSCSARYRGPESWEETRCLSQQNVLLFGAPLLGTACTECSAIRNKASCFPAGEVWTQPMKTPRSRVTRVQRWPFLHTRRQARHSRPGLISFLSLSSVSQGLPQVNFLLSG